MKSDEWNKSAHILNIIHVYRLDCHYFFPLLFTQFYFHYFFYFFFFFVQNSHERLFSMNAKINGNRFLWNQHRSHLEVRFWYFLMGWVVLHIWQINYDKSKKFSRCRWLSTLRKKWIFRIYLYKIWMQLKITLKITSPKNHPQKEFYITESL